MKGFSIDFIRQVIEQKLLEEHIKEPTKYFGGKGQVNLFSFYEQLQKEDEVNRFVEVYRDLTEQQNRTGLIMNGTIIAPENPTITNLSQCLIIPMSFTASFRVKLGDRDSAIDTINHLIDELKGRKQDIAELDNGALFKVGTIANDIDGNPKIVSGDYIGTITSFVVTKNYETKTFTNTIASGDFTYDSVSGTYRYTGIIGESSGKQELEVLSASVSPDTDYSVVSAIITPSGIRYTIERTGITIDSANVSIQYKYLVSKTDEVSTKLSNYALQGITNEVGDGYLYCSYLNKITVIQKDSNDEWQPLENDGSHSDIVFPSEHNSFTKYKLSLSFDSLRCDEPRNLNANEYCTISFGGSATLVDEQVLLGNEMTKLSIKKKEIVGDSTTITDTETWLEPLELPSGNSADTQVNNLLSNKFISNSHTDTITLGMQYTFIVDKNITLLKQLFLYARYGIQGTSTNSYQDGVTPNMTFTIKEMWSSWGEVDIYIFNAKIVESIDIENTESDTLTITIPFQKQGDNN